MGLFNAEHHYVQISDTEYHPNVERTDINVFISRRNVWLSVSQNSGIYLGICCTVFYPKRMKIVENTGKSPFPSSTKALLSPSRLSGKSNCPTVLPGDRLYQISPKSVRKHSRYKVKQFRYRPRGFQEVNAPGFRDNGTGWW